MTQRNETQRDEPRVRQEPIYVYSCCVDPLRLGPRYAPIFWGLVLIAIGAASLVANLVDVEEWGEWAWSAILLAIGAVLLLRSLLGSEQLDRRTGSGR
ncbi:MAG: hypothetical protein GEU80_11920 [Dehalococcoidia bacterium]|nr:hypothetical protein [Dehalococcoidia bacterium]